MEITRPVTTEEFDHFVNLPQMQIGYLSLSGESLLKCHQSVLIKKRYAPDVAYISKTRMPDKSYCPEPPELAIEVMSPSDRDERLAIKLVNYLAAGTVVWVVNPVAQDVAVCVPGKAVQLVKRDDVLDGGDVLPGFQLPVNKIFPEAKS